jgi:putative ABC transport system permease protein
LSEYQEQAPPRLFLRFFRWYCHRDYLEDIEGDLIEKFERKADQTDIKSAKWGFAKDVIRLFRPGIIRPITQTQQLYQLDMFKNYYKIAWRHILKEKFYSFINIAGLAIGITCCILISFFVKHELSYDNYHQKLDRTYRILQEYKSGNERATAPAAEDYQVWGNATVGPAFTEEFPEVDQFCRFTPGHNKLIKVKDELYDEKNIVFGDSTVFDVFSWELLSGNPESVLNKPNTIVLTESLAKKYFGNEDAMGKTVIYSQDVLCVVTGIMKDVPANSHFTFEGIISMGTFYNQRSWIFESWGYVDFYTYFTLKENANMESIKPKLAGLSEKYTGEWEDTKFYIEVEPLKGAYLNSVAARQPGKTGNKSSLIIFSIIGVFILLIACINFINLSTARSLERAKEIGIRKVVGARKFSLVNQFLSEFFLLTFFAGILSLLLVFFLSPYLEEFAGISIKTDDIFNIEFLGIFSIGIIIVGLVAGSYPAFLLSKFQPSKVLKGNFKTGKSGVALRKALVSFQFVLTITLIIGTATVYNQLTYLQEHELGFEKDQIIVMDFGYDGKVQENIEAFKNEFEKTPNILSVCASRAVPGNFFPNAGTQIENPDGKLENHSPAIYEIDPDFLSFYNIKVLAGRGFSYDHYSDSVDALIINNAAAKLWGYNNPEDVIGKKFDQWGKTGKVIGVVDDFNYQSLHTEVGPLTLRFEPYSMAKFSLKLSTGDIHSTIANLEDKWNELIPDRPFTFYFIDDSFDKQYNSDEKFAQLFSSFAVLAILIAFLGLFGLTTYTTAQRTKEIGIRKVMGASLRSIVILLSKDLSKLLLLSFVIAIPISWYATQQWLEGFAYQAPISLSVYIITAFIISGIAFGTMSWQSIKAALQNPVDSLKNE